MFKVKIFISKMLKGNIVKGQYGYLNYQKKVQTLKTILYFLLPLAIFFIGWYTSGSKKNLFTIIAVLGLLPASKNAVTLIMFLKSKGCTDENHQRLKLHIEQLDPLYDLIFTTSERTYPINHLVLKGHSICGFTDCNKLVEKNIEGFIIESLLQNGYKNYTVKIFKDLKKYCERLDQLSVSEVEENKNAIQVLDLLMALSL